MNNAVVDLSNIHVSPSPVISSIPVIPPSENNINTTPQSFIKASSEIIMKAVSLSHSVSEILEPRPSECGCISVSLSYSNPKIIFNADSNTALMDEEIIFSNDNINNNINNTNVNNNELPPSIFPSDCEPPLPLTSNSSPISGIPSFTLSSFEFSLTEAEVSISETNEEIRKSGESEKGNSCSLDPPRKSPSIIKRTTTNLNVAEENEWKKRREMQRQGSAILGPCKDLVVSLNKKLVSTSLLEDSFELDLTVVP